MDQSPIAIPKSRIVFRGSNSVGRVTAFQAVGRGFESRLPLTLPGGEVVVGRAMAAGKPVVFCAQVKLLLA